MSAVTFHVTSRRNIHSLPVLPILKLVNLAVADIVVLVGKRALARTHLGDVAPAALVVFGAVVVEGGGDEHVQLVAFLTGEELVVDVEGDLD